MILCVKAASPSARVELQFQKQFVPESSVLLVLVDFHLKGVASGLPVQVWTAGSSAVLNSFLNQKGLFLRL